jgi:malonate-semialdehyde dehydrogenase (acetylating)/methylmalonate-semialdehyde dehydrogenase
MHGTEGMMFFTKVKTITQRWPKGSKSTADFTLPTMK